MQDLIVIAVFFVAVFFFLKHQMEYFDKMNRWSLLDQQADLTFWELYNLQCALEARGRSLKKIRKDLEYRILFKQWERERKLADAAQPWNSKGRCFFVNKKQRPIARVLSDC